MTWTGFRSHWVAEFIVHEQVKGNELYITDSDRNQVRAQLL